VTALARTYSEIMITKRLQELEHVGFAAVRIISGLMFSLHGIQKLFGTFGLPAAVPLTSQFGIGGVIELVTGILIALGLCTRPAAFLASGQMAVAYFQFHVAKTGQILPIQNGGDDTVLYCFWFLFLVFKGAGPYSLDARRSSARG